MFALNKRYLINEKGALQEAASFPLTIPNLSKRVENVWQLVGDKEFEPALATLRTIDEELKAVTNVHACYP